MSITVFLADDHAMVRDGLQLLLETSGEIDVIGQAGSGRETVQLAKQKQPDVVLMDIAMPELNGIEATRQLIANNPEIKVIILSMHATSEYIYQALQAGASGYLLKESVGQEVVEAVHEVVKGQRYLSQKITETLVDDYLFQREIGQTRSPVDRLSPREREVLQMVAEGHSSAKIAAQLALSPKTVDTYRSRIMQKIGVRDVTELVKFAIRHGLTSLD
jgi:DNA-binding NarL/FixJ family response regulator